MAKRKGLAKAAIAKKAKASVTTVSESSTADESSIADVIIEACKS